MLPLSTQHKIEIMRIATDHEDALDSNWELRYKKMVDLIENYKPDQRSSDKK